MTGSETGFAGIGPRGWRLARWSGVAGLLALPGVAMQFTPEVNWTASDFLFMALLLGSVVGLYELAARRSDPMFRLGVALAVLTGFLIIWINLAVGIAHSDLIVFFGPPLVALIGSALARFRPAGMALAMVGAAAIHFPAAMIVVPKHATWPLTVIFAAMWLGSAWLFRRAGSN